MSTIYIVNLTIIDLINPIDSELETMGVFNTLLEAQKFKEKMEKDLINDECNLSYLNIFDFIIHKRNT
jgi:hypothetical protein